MASGQSLAGREEGIQVIRPASGVLAGSEAHSLGGTKDFFNPHTGTVLSGHGAIQYEDGQHLDLLPGMVFHITTTPHDSWVVGDVPYVSLHVLKPDSH